jgi:peptide/nickel transport system substrate-binding protein
MAASIVCHRGGGTVKWGIVREALVAMDEVESMDAMDRLNRWISFLGGLAMLAGVLACSGEGQGEGSRAGVPADAVRISQGSDLISLDPYYKLESPSFTIQRNIFDPLVDYDANIKMTPCLAESWRLKDPTHWEFTLRRGVKFHEGQPFTAADAAYSIRRAQAWPLSRVKSEIPTIAHATAVDDFTLLIETNIPDAILPLRLSAILILNQATSEAAIEQSGDEWLATHANGTGPYRVTHWRKDEVCLLEASPNYWGKPPEVRHLAFIPTNNDATRMASLARGEYDVMVNVPPRYEREAARAAGYRIVKRPSLRLIYLGLDCGREASPGAPGSPPNPLRDPRVRRAMAAAIDNRLIVEKIMGGNATPAGQLFPEGVTGYDPALALGRPNRELARELLAEAGYPRGFSVRLDGPNDRYVNDTAIVQAVAGLLARVGIRVEVNATPKAVFFTQEEKAECSFFLMGWANTNGDGAATFDHLLHTPAPGGGYGESNNSTQYANPELDRLDEAASQEFDPAKRSGILQQANRLAMRDLVHIPLHFQMDIYAVSDRVEWSPRRDTQVRGTDLKIKK